VVKAGVGLVVQTKAFVSSELDIGEGGPVYVTSMLSLEIRPPGTTKHEVGQVPEPIWMFWRKEKSLALPYKEHDSLVFRPVA
jgi:hypothetical protein